MYISQHYLLVNIYCTVCTSLITCEHWLWGMTRSILMSIYHTLVITHEHLLVCIVCIYTWKKPVCFIRGTQENIAAIVNSAMSCTTYNLKLYEIGCHINMVGTCNHVGGSYNLYRIICTCRNDTKWSIYADFRYTLNILNPLI